MNLTTLTPLKTLRYFHRKQEVSPEKLADFKRNVAELLTNLSQTAREAKQETDLRDFLNNAFYKEQQYYINKKETADWVIYNGKDASAKVGVIIEVKSTNNASEMLSLEKPNVKALHELVLYYLRERIDNNNHEIKHLIATNGFEWFIFNENTFGQQVFTPTLQKAYKEWKTSGKDTSHFYKYIAKDHLSTLKQPLECCYVDLRSYHKASDKKLAELYKVLSPEHLLKQSLNNDANKLNTPFYNELLYLIGVEETKSADSNKKVIERTAPARRQIGSLLENAITILLRKGCLEQMNNLTDYGQTPDEQQYSVALELCITWLNRILFLKLLEGQLVNFHRNNQEYRFLSYQKISDFDEVAELFFEVLAVPVQDRHISIQERYGQIPYLNSSLFELSPLEKQTISIEDLKDRLEIPYFANTVLREDKGKPKKGQVKTLNYLLDFLGAYNFSSNAQEPSDHKTLINASVLGLIFEKLNGYKEGSFFTPAFVTMFMCRESVRQATVQKFNEAYQWSCTDFDDLKEQLSPLLKEKRTEFNALLNTLRICDPAVGSGHFLVSALNEIIAIKSELRLIQHPNGTRLTHCSISIENDELVVFDEDEGQDFVYQLSKSNTLIAEKQLIQQTLFEEKRIIIENCLFGVDINPKSVAICQLRLWIELLKNAYYSATPYGLQLQTLPNIDINIKTGNSLVSRLPLDFALKELFTKDKYKYELYLNAVKSYKNTRNKKEKNELLDFIKAIKNQAFETALKRDIRVIKLSKLKVEIHSLQNKIYIGDLIEGTLVDKKLLEKEDSLKKQIRQLEESIENDKKSRFYRNTFEWRTEYPEVMNSEGEYVGFDLVIGNPPYIKAGEFNEFKNQFKQSYPHTFVGTADLYVYFMERAISLLKPNGLLTFIVPNKWMRTGYGENLRNWLKTLQLTKIIDFGDLPVFEEATAYPCIVSIQNQSNTNNTLVAANVKTLEFEAGGLSAYVTNNGFSTSVEAFSDQEGWILSDATTQSLLQRLKQTGISLDKYINGQVFYGLKTGLNAAFVIEDKQVVDELIAQDPRSAEVIFPFVEGKDVKRYQSLPIHQYLILFRKGQTREYFVQKEYQRAVLDNQENDVKFDPKELWSYLYKTIKITQEDAFEWLSTHYPAITKHLLPYKDKAIERGDKGEFWWELRACSYYEEFEKPKLVYPNICRRPEFTFDDSAVFTNQKCFIVGCSDYYLLGVLNSAITNFLFRNILPALRGNFYEPNYALLKDFPIAIPSTIERVKIAEKVNQILEIKKATPQADTTALEAEIDELVFDLYGLTLEERQMVLSV
ncbi:MAG: Eco57I restriction-modification methylase domain-containing protein [Spirosomataceae bacterium]